MFGGVTQSFPRSAQWADKSLTSLSAGSLIAVFPLELSQQQKNEKSEIYNLNFTHVHSHRVLWAWVMALGSAAVLGLGGR